MGNYKMKFIVTKLIYLLIFIVGLSVFAEETSLEGAYIWTLKYPDGNETVEKIYFKNKNKPLHQNLWAKSGSGSSPSW